MPVDRDAFEKMQVEDEIQEERILDYVRDHPDTLTSQIASEVQIPLNTVLTILKELEKDGKVTHKVRSGMHSWTIRPTVRQKRQLRTQSDEGSDVPQDLNTGSKNV